MDIIWFQLIRLVWRTVLKDSMLMAIFVSNVLLLVKFVLPKVASNAKRDWFFNMAPAPITVYQDFIE